MKLLHGDAAARLVSQRIAAQVADTATMAAIPQDRRLDGMICVTLDTCSLWVYDEDSVIAASATIIAPASGTGRWRRLAAGAAA